MVFEMQPGVIFAPADFFHIEGLHVVRLCRKEGAAKGLQVGNVAVSVHDENIKPGSKAPFIIGWIAFRWNNHNWEIWNNVAPPFKADSDMPHATACGD